MILKKKYPLHSDFDAIHWLPVLKGSSKTVIKCINMAFGMHSKTYQNKPEVTVEKNSVISCCGAHEFVTHVFKPADKEGPLPCILYYHGGGFYFGAAKAHFEIAEYYAREMQCAVLFPDYRLSLKHPFPHGFNDCYQTLKWAQKNAKSLGIDPTNIVVAGDSAGGCLAASVAIRARDEKFEGLRGQLLVYPVLDHNCNTKSATEFTDTPVWNAISNRHMWKFYLNGHNEIPTYASPMAEQDYTNLAPAHIDVAEFDPLRDEAIHYAKKLEADGVNVNLVETESTFHGYDTFFGSTLSKSIFAKRKETLNTFFSG